MAWLAGIFGLTSAGHALVVWAALVQGSMTHKGASSLLFVDSGLAIIGLVCLVACIALKE
jgi:hypothetical protein